MRVTLRQLEILRAISIAGSISRATRQLGMSQPSVSQQIAKMEDALGVLLFVRRRSPRTELTPAGMYWASSAERILADVDAAETRHLDLFDERGLSLSFGATPSLAGRFIERVAEIAVSVPRISRFDHVWAINSAELTEKLMMHKVNVAVLSAERLEPHRASLSVFGLFDDQIVLAVPASVPEDIVRACLSGINAPRHIECLDRYVDIGDIAHWSAKTRNWYHNLLPGAHAYFGCMTHETAVRIVAAGLATCHIPMSMIPNLPDDVRNRVRFYQLEKIARSVALAMPKHLNSVGPFRDFASQVSELFRDEYTSERLGLSRLPLPNNIVN